MSGGLVKLTDAELFQGQLLVDFFQYLIDVDLSGVHGIKQLESRITALGRTQSRCIKKMSFMLGLSIVGGKF